MSEISQRLKRYIDIRIPYAGVAILKKQCLDLGIDMEDIHESDLELLGEKMGKAAEMFLGGDKSRQLGNRVKRGDF